MASLALVCNFISQGATVSFRAGLEVLTLPITRSCATFIRALLQQTSLLDALCAATEVDTTFDLSATLALLLQHHLITTATDGPPGERHHERQH